MHPYEMQRLIKQRGKDRVINVAWRASLYQTIGRLVSADLVRIAGTHRESGRPERTVYEITDDGRTQALAWVREMLESPKDEFPEFLAGISYLPLLEPAEVLPLLQVRRSQLWHEHEELANGINLAEGMGMPRLVLLEDELRSATLGAELAWLDGLIADLEVGALSWTHAEVAAFAAASNSFEPAEEDLP